MTIVEITAATVRFSAMNLLSLREHSAEELYKKLSKKYPQSELIVTTIKRLTEDGLQSDARFAEAFVTMRKRQGKGPLLINMELKERGVAAELINKFLQCDSESWKILAATVRQKKFGQLFAHCAKGANDVKETAREKAKQMRFLAARGFTTECIQYALKYSDCHDA